MPLATCCSVSQSRNPILPGMSLQILGGSLLQQIDCTEAAVILHLVQSIIWWTCSATVPVGARALGSAPLVKGSMSIDLAHDMANWCLLWRHQCFELRCNTMPLACQWPFVTAPRQLLFVPCASLAKASLGWPHLTRVRQAVHRHCSLLVAPLRPINRFQRVHGSPRALLSSSY